MLDKELIRYIGDKKKYIVLIVLLNVINLIFTLLVTSSLISLIYLAISDNSLFYLPIIVIMVSIIAKIILSYNVNKLTTLLTNYVTTKLRNDTYNKFLDLNCNTPFTLNEMSSLQSEGIEQLRLYYSEYLPSFFYAMIAPIILFIMFLFLDWMVAIIYLVCIPLIPLSIILVSKWAKKVFNKYWDIYLNLGDTFLDSVRGMKELRIFKYTNQKAKEMAESSENFRKITMKVLVMQLYSITIMDLVAYGGAAIGIVLSLNAMNNGLNPYIVLFMILVGAEFFLPLRRLGSAFHVAMNGATAGKKVMKLLGVSSKSRDILLNDNINSIKVNDLSFKYHDNYIVNNINLEFKKGIYSIVGLSGSGKSTIAKLLANKLDNYEGHILYNNELESKELNLTNFYHRVCYIANNTYIFNKTIRDSFLFYNPSIKEERMLELLDLVKLSTLVNKNGGLDFIIKDNASNISGGEKQRFIIAFYLANDYDFYIFDEATSNIDIESEEIILDLINGLAKDKIVLNITHRLKNVINSNYIYYLEDKKIIEEGSPKDLLNKDSKFRNIYNYQSSLEAIR